MKTSRAAATVAPLAALALLLSACTEAPVSRTPGASRPTSASAPRDAARDTARDAAAFASLRKVDDHPLWQMRFEGTYQRESRSVAPAVPPTAGFGCSLFFAGGDRDDPQYARNFDWRHGPALLLFTDPPDGYASVSVVDTTYLGLKSSADFTTEHGKRGLLQAPLLPFDGMNSKGLAVGFASVDRADGPKGGTKVGSTRIQRIVLDKAATVAEALTLFGQYELDFTDGPPLHYFLADAGGDSAVVELVGGKTVVAERGRKPWNGAVNFTFADTPAAGRLQDRRYGAATKVLDDAQGTLDTDGSFGLLRTVAQSHTQWSVVYGMKTGKVTLVTGQRWEKRHEFTLPMDGAQGPREGPRDAPTG
ncbi:carcinine hydrolase/isopenicillin-N N-acyltransferase family protein [Streptomyces sp. NBC_00237]|uniref:carcinine hydrolase/isopenicillin-N N-acyltransferase family protein n=1 Tax=Streptomyces sp. NBC_00237 TaxID=2975687 RepID=UPI0022519B3B|nr:carcinine hydrolase/isopenicillin-N N-acyltransferase family protein [Streptomyces sp. NBC_00237]MCX5201939.1 carcinine hydrolase/isopenicillin-N N-acyltransferase family protein [Streptomyces sp. NBC_00237]